MNKPKGSLMKNDFLPIDYILKDEKIPFFDLPPAEKCAVKGTDGVHCPEDPINKVDTDFLSRKDVKLCKRCYVNYKAREYAKKETYSDKKKGDWIHLDCWDGK